MYESSIKKDLISLIFKCKDLLTLKLKNHISKGLFSFKILLILRNLLYSQTLACTYTRNGQQYCMISSTRNQLSIDTSKFSIPYNIDLADIGYNIPAELDMIIRADLYFDLVEPDLIKLGPNLTILQNSEL
ncbi:hypothetical protein JTB14_012513 [Gonioctena quinquepunctata]|nr:hypothetical protein JTB14_012513 [Gonioctena quinquepunctata]